LKRPGIRWKGTTLATSTTRKASAPSKDGTIGIVSATSALDQKSVIDVVLASLDDGKAEEIITIDIQGKSALADHLVIASGRSTRHVAAIADQILTALKEAGFKNTKVEGLPMADWVLVDADDVIVHIFRPEVRSFYNIEKMWQVPELDATKH
jgi:ribosome-associated protein